MEEAGWPCEKLCERDCACGSRVKDSGSSALACATVMSGRMPKCRQRGQQATTSSRWLTVRESISSGALSACSRLCLRDAAAAAMRDATERAGGLTGEARCGVLGGSGEGPVWLAVWCEG